MAFILLEVVFIKFGLCEVYAMFLVLLAKEEKVLPDMIDKLIETGRCYGMEMNVEKTNVMRISLAYATHNTHKPIPSLPR